MTEPLTPSTDPFENPSNQPTEPPTAPVYPAAESTPDQPTAPQPPVVQPPAVQPPMAPPPAYPGQPTYPGQPAYPQPAYPGQPAYPQAVQPGPAYQPYQAYQPGGAPVSGMPTSGYPTAAYPGAPMIDPMTGMPIQPVKKKSKAPMIVAIVLAVVLLICVGGGLGIFFYFKNSVDPMGKGADTPKAAAVAFVKAYYQDKSATAAAKATCKELRDDKVIADRLKAINAQLEKYPSAKVTWTEPVIENAGKTTAVAKVKLTLSTGDEKASTLDLKITLVQNDGWRGCDVN